MSTLTEIEAAAAKLGEKERSELLRYLHALNVGEKSCGMPGNQLMDLAGTIRLREDPLEEQRRMRDEWQ